MVRKYGHGMGWFLESQRHSLSAKGVKTGRKSDNAKSCGINYAEMNPSYDSRKSFYGKADVRIEGDKLILKSYSTDVAYIENGKAVVNGTYSPTTLRHIKEFLKQNGFIAESSSQIMKDYGSKEGKESEKEPSQKILHKDEEPSISKSSMGTEFNLGNGMVIIARTAPSRDGFNHVAELYKNGQLVDSKKVHYINRTWESYDFETAISGLLDKAGISADEKKKIMGTTSKLSLGKSDKEFKSVAMVASLGNIFGATLKEKNDWKARMLKAGLSGKGFEQPSDWDTLSEDEKEKRLNNVIKFVN